MKKKDNIVPPSKRMKPIVLQEKIYEEDGSLIAKFEQTLDQASSFLSVDRKQLCAAFNNKKQTLVNDFSSIAEASRHAHFLMATGGPLAVSGLLINSVSSGSLAVTLSLGMACIGILGSCISLLPLEYKISQSKTIRSAVTEHQKRLTDMRAPKSA